MIPNDILTSDPGLCDWSILAGYRGSIAHGMYVPQENPTSVDDKDLMAVCVPPPDCYVGLNDYGSRGTKEIKRGEWDVVIYELKKFMLMLQQGNPNVLGMLWLGENYYTHMTEQGRMLIRRRNLFVGRHVYNSFAGYAHGQLHRMTHAACEGYMGEKRKKLVELFGYDTKNAAHLIRLLRMAIEFLKDGELYVLRQDAQQLLEIKRGEWTLEQVKAEADRLFKLTDQAYVESKLPAAPQKEAISALCQDIILDTWRERGSI